MPTVPTFRRAAFTLALLAASAASASSAQAQPRGDSLAIRAAAADYIEGWYSGDGDRMARALHPELVKRIIGTDSAGRMWVSGMGATQLIRGTRSGGGKNTPADQKKTDIRILDIFQNSASVRIDAGAWIDYLHLVRFNGQWVILNVLWENRRAG